MPEVKTNGIATHYEDVGAGPAIVFIHGHSLDLRMWNYQVEEIAAAGFRVIRYDVRGHGKSGAPGAGYTWDNYVRDLAELLDQIEISTAHVVGCSMGGGIALAFTLAHPKQVRSLTFVDTILPGFSYSPDFGKLMEDLRTTYQSEGQAAFERLWLTYTLFEGVARQPERFAEVREQVMAYPAREYRSDYGGEPGYTRRT